MKEEEFNTEGSTSQGLSQHKPNQSAREPMEENEDYSNQASQWNIKEGLMIHAKGPGKMGGSVGTHVGTVDHIDGDYVKLAKKDSADGEHHWIPLDWIESVDNKTLYLKVNETEFRRGLLNEEPADARKVMN